MSRRFPAPVRAASRLALGWAGWYTEGLEPAIAADRRDEIASDVWEQAAGQAGRPAALLAASIASRTLRGMPSDLAWRWRMPSVARRAEPLVRVALGIAVALAAALLTLGIAGLGRTALGLLRGEALPSAITVASLVVGVLALMGGFALLARARTRRLGLLWLGGASGLVLHFGTLALVTLSETLSVVHVGLYVASDAWLAWWFVIVGVVVAYPAVVAASLSPRPEARA